MPTGSEFQKFQERFSIRRVDPAEKPRTVSEKLAWVARDQKISTRWMQAEVKKLIPDVEKLEREKTSYLMGMTIFGCISIVLLLITAT